MAYNELGLDDVIPPNSNLTYTIHLLDIIPDEDFENINIPDRKAIGIRKRERGNWWYNRQEYRQAIQCYRSAIDYLDDDTLEFVSYFY